jgi:hypothetical protein
MSDIAPHALLADTVCGRRLSEQARADEIPPHWRVVQRYYYVGEHRITDDWTSIPEWTIGSCTTGTVHVVPANIMLAVLATELRAVVLAGGFPGVSPEYLIAWESLPVARDRGDADEILGAS